MGSPPIPPVPQSSAQQPGGNDDRLKDKKNVPPFDWKKSALKNQETLKDALDKEEAKPSPMQMAARSKMKEEEKKHDEDASGNLSQSMSQIQVQMQEKSQSVQQVTSSAGVNTELLEVAKQVSDYIKSMNVSSVKDETITSVVIHSRGAFNNATIEVRTVGREHNLFFRNLNEQAQAILTNKVHEATLRRALDDQGITVHRIETYRIEQPINTSDAQQPDQGDSDSEQDDRGGQGQNQRNRE